MRIDSGLPLLSSDELLAVGDDVDGDEERVVFGAEEEGEGGWRGRSTIQSCRSNGSVYLKFKGGDQMSYLVTDLLELGKTGEETHPIKDFHLARGLICFGFPTKLTSLLPVS